MLFEEDGSGTWCGNARLAHVASAPEDQAHGMNGVTVLLFERVNERGAAGGRDA